MAFDPDEARAGRIDDHLNAALGAIGLPVPALAAIGYGVVVGQQTIEVFGFKLSTQAAATVTCAVIAALFFYAGRCFIAIAALLDQLADPARALFRLRTHPSSFNPFLAIGGRVWLDLAGAALIGLLHGLVGSLLLLIVVQAFMSKWPLPTLWTDYASLLAADALAFLSAGFMFWALIWCVARVNTVDVLRRVLVCSIAAVIPLTVAVVASIWTVWIMVTFTPR